VGNAPDAEDLTTQTFLPEIMSEVQLPEGNDEFGYQQTLKNHTSLETLQASTLPGC